MRASASLRQRVEEKDSVTVSGHPSADKLSRPASGGEQAERGEVRER